MTLHDDLTRTAALLTAGWPIRNLSRAKRAQEQQMKGLYKYTEYFGRMGHLSGVFVATRAEIKAAKKRGTTYLGEVLGKHSEISATISDETIKLLTEDRNAIAIVEEHDLANGTNPLAYGEGE